VGLMTAINQALYKLALSLNSNKPDSQSVC